MLWVSFLKDKSCCLVRRFPKALMRFECLVLRKQNKPPSGLEKPSLNPSLSEWPVLCYLTLWISIQRHFFGRAFRKASKSWKTERLVRRWRGWGSGAVRIAERCRAAGRGWGLRIVLLGTGMDECLPSPRVIAHRSQPSSCQSAHGNSSETNKCL